MNKIRGEQGQAMMATVAAISIIALIFISAVVYQSMLRSKSSVNSSKGITAYEIANAAIQKGEWALYQQTSNWTLVEGGGVIPGYDGNAIFTDVPGGQYKVLIAAASGVNSIMIKAFAKDNSPTPQYAGLEVVLSKPTSPFGALMAYKIHLTRRTNVHWGPIYAYSSIHLEDHADLYYPQIFSMGKITPLDTSPTPPNTDGKQWWAFDATPGVPTWPNIDFAYYKALAQQEGTYYARGDRSRHITHEDDDSRHLDEGEGDDDSYSYHDIIDTQPYVRFFDTGVKAKFKGGNDFLRGIIIAMDKVDFKDGTASVSSVNSAYAAAGLGPYYPHVVNIPQNAWKQYQLVDTSSPGDYPGDIGGPGASGQSTTYTFGAQTTDNLDTTATIQFEGLLYAAKKIKLHRGGLIVGVVMSQSKTVEMGDSSEDESAGDDANYDDDCHRDDSSCNPQAHEDHTYEWESEGAARHLGIFYQDDLGIKLTGSSQASQQSWQQISVTPF